MRQSDYTKQTEIKKHTFVLVANWLSQLSIVCLFSSETDPRWVGSFVSSALLEHKASIVSALGVVDV